jgi:hypothetical protein
MSSYANLALNAPLMHGLPPAHATGNCAESVRIVALVLSHQSDNTSTDRLYKQSSLAPPWQVDSIRRGRFVSRARLVDHSDFASERRRLREAKIKFNKRGQHLEVVPLAICPSCLKKLRA